MKNVNLSENQSMQVLRYANRVPLQFQPAACAITQSVTGDQLAGLQFGSIPRSIAGRSGHRYGACRQRMGAVYQ